MHVIMIHKIFQFSLPGLGSGHAGAAADVHLDHLRAAGLRSRVGRGNKAEAGRVG